MRTSFRTVLFGLAGLLGLLAIWILAAEIYRTAVSYRPSRPATASATSRFRPTLAPWFGMFRGDLWADDAVALAAELAREKARGSGSSVPEATIKLRSAAERAVALAPHDARLWLLLAAIDAQIDPLDTKVAAALKMSYYSGPNETALMPVRLLLAARTETVADPELQSLFARELRVIVSQAPDLKSAVVESYRDALPENRRLIDTTVGDVDQNFLAAIKSGIRR